MDDPQERTPARNPGPWRFCALRYGHRHVIVDSDGSPMVFSVPVGSGPLLAAGPELLSALQRVAELAVPGSEIHTVASNAIETFGEREGILLMDWKPWTNLRPRPTRVVAGLAN